MMKTADIIQLIAIMLPVAQKAGLDVYGIIQGLQAGRTTDELIAEAEAKRDDLPVLNFGQAV